MKGINLLPWREQKREEEKKQFFILLGSITGITLLILILTHIWIASAITQQKSVNDYLNQEISILDQKITKIKSLQNEKKRLLSRMQLIEKLQQERPEIIHLFEGLVKVTPKGAFILNMSRTGDTIKISGKAQSNSEISALLKNIEHYPWFSKPILNEIKTDSSDPTYDKKFEIQFNEQSNL